MNKFLDVLKTNLFEMAFGILLVRILVLGSSSIPEAIALVSLVSSIAYNKYLNKEKLSDKEELLKRLEAIESSVQSLHMKQGIRRETNEQKVKGTQQRFF